MKTYFAKYLPVEGEIKEGDKAIDSNIHHPDNVVTLIFDKYGTASDGRGTYSDEGFKKLKKVKLFLCSRDIQVGDKFDQLPGINGKVYTCTEVGIGSYKDDEGKWRSFLSCFKVIGEISPEATWVKEGDEFDETEIGILMENGDVVPRPPVVIPNNIIVIKCPTCQTFH